MWDAASEKISRAEKKSHVPGELHNRAGLVARVLSRRSALANSRVRLSAVKRPKRERAMDSDHGPVILMLRPLLGRQLTRCCEFRKMSYLSSLAILVSSTIVLTRLLSILNSVSAATSISSETYALLSTLQTSGNPATRTQRGRGQSSSVSIHTRRLK